jgi:hypothetical protein
MRQTMVLVLLLGCSPDGAGDDDHPHPPPEGQGDEDVAKDREECELANAAASCPPSWGWSVRSGPGASDDDEFVELEDVAESVCNGRGLYAEPEAFEGAIGGPEVTVVRNSQCSIVCYPQCSFTSVCYAKNPDGRPCGEACMPPGLDKAECTELVAECIGEDTAACGGG